MKDTKHQGDLAQIEFLYRAMEMGLIVSEPYGDNSRYDFAVDNGKRILRVQVKSTTSLCVDRKEQYNVNVGRHIQGNAVAYTKEEIDVMAVLVKPEQRWYLLTWEELGERVALKIFGGERGKTGLFGKNLEAWGILLE